eukprot:3452374-Prymnesium_polylepis.2
MRRCASRSRQGLRRAHQDRLPLFLFLRGSARWALVGGRGVGSSLSVIAECVYERGWGGGQRWLCACVCVRACACVCVCVRVCILRGAPGLPVPRAFPRRRVGCEGEKKK